MVVVVVVVVVVVGGVVVVAVTVVIVVAAVVVVVVVAVVLELEVVPPPTWPGAEVPVTPTGPFSSGGVAAAMTTLPASRQRCFLLFSRTWPRTSAHTLTR
jgi:hypothetical protein